MRTNYKRISNLLTKIGAEIIKSPTHGLAAVFDVGLDTEQRVRVVLCDGNQYSNEIGCHMTRIDQDSFESHLYDTLETALKDNFPTIRIHQRSKPDEDLRQRKIKAVEGWIEAFNKRADASYSLRKLEFEPLEVIKGMTQDQIEAVLALIVASSVRASGESRDWWSKAYHELKAELKQAN